MSNNFASVFGLALSLLLLAGCAPSKSPTEDAPPPPQNLLGATDELQLVTELSVNLAKKYGGDRVLVILEIDDTLLTAGQESECPSSTMRPVQEDAADQVRRMQESGLKVIALTARGSDCGPQTLSELDRNGFSFLASAWSPAAGYSEAFSPEGSTQPVAYQQGVYFVGGQDKGVMLKALLEKSGVTYPVLIVMADHDQESLNAVMRLFSWTDTKVHAWRYTRSASAASGTAN
jgi:hypothetical protein